jgi:putative transposase
VGDSRSSVDYRHTCVTQALLRQKIREFAKARVRWGYRRIHVLLRREEWLVNAKCVHRL